MAGSSPSLPDGSNPSAAIVQSASDVQCSRLLKMTQELERRATSIVQALDDATLEAIAAGTLDMRAMCRQVADEIHQAA